MRAKRIDANQNEIVNQLRKIKASVFITSMVGKGFPDIVVGLRGINFLIELKDSSKPNSAKKLTTDEQAFFDTWKGTVYKCETFDEILQIISKQYKISKMNYKKFLSVINSKYEKGTTDDKIECIIDLIKTVVTGNEIQKDVHCINKLREGIHNLSPFKNEPVDFVKWVMAEDVVANDYNPNKVAPPEMELLEVSIMNDGYTQPVVTFPNNGKIEVVDGFHRTRVSKESKVVRERVKGYTPTVIIRKEQSDKNDRIASTIRHNRARGKHQVDAMSEIVLELKNRNWKNERIARELGMDEEEILRLCQITGLQDIFKDDDFSRSWEASDSIHNYEPLTDDISEEEAEHYRTVNTNDPTRIFHTFDKWECHKAGFYASSKDGMTADECEKSYAEFLSDNERFKEALDGVIRDWVNSCEHYLTNKAMNRIAWLGQAAMCYATGIPSKFCSGFNLLTGDQQDKANATALQALNYWMKKYNMEEVSMEDALSIGRQVNIY